MGEERTARAFAKELVEGWLHTPCKHAPHAILQTFQLSEECLRLSVEELLVHVALDQQRQFLVQAAGVVTQTLCPVGEHEGGDCIGCIVAQQLSAI